MYIGRPNSRRGWHNDREGQRGARERSKSSSNKRGIGTTRSRRVINERDSQDFTVARVVFVKRPRRHYRQHQSHRERRVPMNERKPSAPRRCRCSDGLPRSMSRSGAARAIYHRRYIAVRLVNIATANGPAGGINWRCIKLRERNGRTDHWRT